MDKPGSPAGEANGMLCIVACTYTSLPKTLRERLLNVTLEDLQRVAQQYLIDQKPIKAVVAPFAKREQLEQLVFKLNK
jgi:Zn-dependent M16 (insulinase) family peptidase